GPGCRLRSATPRYGHRRDNRTRKPSDGADREAVGDKVPNSRRNRRCRGSIKAPLGAQDARRASRGASRRRRKERKRPREANRKLSSRRWETWERDRGARFLAAETTATPCNRLALHRAELAGRIGAGRRRERSRTHDSIMAMPRESCNEGGSAA